MKVVGPEKESDMFVQGKIDGIPMTRGLFEDGNSVANIDQAEHDRLLHLLESAAAPDIKAELEIESESAVVVQQMNSTNPDPEFQVLHKLAERVRQQGGYLKLFPVH